MSKLTTYFGNHLAPDERPYLIVLAVNYETKTRIVVPAKDSDIDYERDGYVIASDIAIVNVSGERMVAVVAAGDDGAEGNVTLAPIAGFHFRLIDSPEFNQSRARIREMRNETNAD